MRKQGTGTFGTEVMCTEIRMCDAPVGGTAMRVKLLSEKAGVWMDVPIGSNIDVGDEYTLVLMKMEDGGRRLMGGAREFFCAVRDAAQRIRDAPLKVEQMEQEAVMRSRRDGPRGKGGVTDPSRRIDDMIDYENRLAREQAEDRLLVTRGEMVVDGLRQIDPMGADVLFERYLNLSPWPIVAFTVGLTLAHTRERESLAFDRIDSEGIAAMGIGDPWATVADGGAYRAER